MQQHGTEHLDSPRPSNVAILGLTPGIRCLKGSICWRKKSNSDWEKGDIVATTAATTFSVSSVFCMDLFPRCYIELEELTDRKHKWVTSDDWMSLCAPVKVYLSCHLIDPTKDSNCWSLQHICVYTCICMQCVEYCCSHNMLMYESSRCLSLEWVLRVIAGINQAL